MNLIQNIKHFFAVKRSESQNTGTFIEQPRSEEKKLENTDVLDEYIFPESPFKTRLETLAMNLHRVTIEQTNSDNVSGGQNALYSAITAKMIKKAYNGDNSAYLISLLSSINEGKRYFRECCYDNDYADDIFRQLNFCVAYLLEEAS